MWAVCKCDCFQIQCDRGHLSSQVVTLLSPVICLCSIYFYLVAFDIRFNQILFSSPSSLSSHHQFILIYLILFIYLSIYWFHHHHHHHLSLMLSSNMPASVFYCHRWHSLLSILITCYLFIISTLPSTVSGSPFEAAFASSPYARGCPESYKKFEIMTGYAFSSPADSFASIPVSISVSIYFTHKHATICWLSSSTCHLNL